MLLPLHLFTQIWESSHDPWLLMGGEWHHCSGWGSRPTWNGSHIHLKHIQGDWQHSYAVDDQMDPSPCCYQRTCWPRFGDMTKILGWSYFLNHTNLKWLRLKTHMKWFPHPPQANTRCLTTFICCGWADGSITMLLPLHLLAQIFEFNL